MRQINILHLLGVVPYKIHTILTDNGLQFAEQPRNRGKVPFRKMRFDMICEANGTLHRLTGPYHPWTSGQVERMNRTGHGCNREAISL